MDDQPVHTAKENIPSVPGRIMMNLWNGTGVDYWLEPYDGTTPLHAYYDRVRFIPE
ncbi:Beta-glucanase precursor [compost metagenome]